MTLLRRDFKTRDELLKYLREQFPDLPGPFQPGSMKGGRKEALLLLDQVDPGLYAKTRNHLNGTVTHLSPYIRHGAVSLIEVADGVMAKKGTSPGDYSRLIQELAWHDYFHRVFSLLGEEVWLDVEEGKCGLFPEDYQDHLPADIARGQTGLSCMDQFIANLLHDGYLHNHARLWLAAYVIHFRRIAWQAGARWFLTHLLDGDEASNNLSWQWVGSTFASKPYFFNKENLIRFHPTAPCNQCPRQFDCPFEGSYSQLQKQLFPQSPEGHGKDE